MRHFVNPRWPSYTDGSARTRCFNRLRLIRIYAHARWWPSTLHERVSTRENEYIACVDGVRGRESGSVLVRDPLTAYRCLLSSLGLEPAAFSHLLPLVTLRISLSLPLSLPLSLVPSLFLSFFYAQPCRRAHLTETQIIIVIVDIIDIININIIVIIVVMLSCRHHLSSHFFTSFFFNSAPLSKADVSILASKKLGSCSH